MGAADAVAVRPDGDGGSRHDGAFIRTSPLRTDLQHAADPVFGGARGAVGAAGWRRPARIGGEGRRGLALRRPTAG
ncbi:hypothetical protein GCM10010495_33800 [Kitasatospora herbaricolor]|nr:hypothetical protein GCM10010495_33800 [Kitasatospora herbaricolor]